MDTQLFKERKNKLEKRLSAFGIDDYKITSALYLKFNPDYFALPNEIAKRIMILYSTFHVATNMDDHKGIKDWLIKVSLWKDISDTEKMLFDGKIDQEEILNEYSWNIEKAYILAWTLNLVDDRPTPTGQITDNQFENFINKIPELGEENLTDFINKQQLRDRTEIYDENLFNELVTTYFRDLLFNGKENITNLDPAATFERHYALNWTRRFSGILDWDETDTST